jgi:hypothetical protein
VETGTWTADSASRFIDSTTNFFSLNLKMVKHHLLAGLICTFLDADAASFVSGVLVLPPEAIVKVSTTLELLELIIILLNIFHIKNSVLKSKLLNSAVSDRAAQRGAHKRERPKGSVA